ncbi:HesB/YadR/YfhF family protein [Sediminibacillus halophilus]|uniref:Uncharacterized protein YneR n=1 Tax=Sediminibacillus halophilus TaxID=482461 RepID=A0A1G9M9G2_9BACI|nr:HesB/YadR/YfhF family protein [Sediminibacillus halophilus]SDL70849.1 Uncharacterized protein YneR [Sediminibacillus halophilus]
MDLQISESATQWYIEELDLDKNEQVRFFVRYGGVGGHQPGFSLGVTREDPENPTADSTVNGIHFFIEEDDSWYFDGADLQVEMDSEEPKFLYK